MSEKLVRTCDACGRDLAHQEHVHVAVRWRAASFHNPLDLDFCDYKCVMEYFATHDGQPKAQQ